MGVRLVVHNFKYQETDYTGTHNHEAMVHRDWLDQHPIYAITGLQEILNTIEKNLMTINRIIVTKETEIKQYSDNNDKKIRDDLNARIDSLKTVEGVQETDTIKTNYDETTKILSADIKIYQDPNDTNILQYTSQGLYVPKTIGRETNTVSWTGFSVGEAIGDMFVNGLRFSHNSTSTYNPMYNSNEANSWYYDENEDAIVQRLNTNSYNGIVSTDLYNNYKHCARITSTDSDNDANGIVIGLVLDENGRQHTLSAMIQRGGGIYLSYRFAIIYNFQLPGQQLIASYDLSNSSGGWSSWPNGMTLFITKYDNKITASAAPWGYVNNCQTIEEAEDIPFEYTFSIDLHNYSWGYLFCDKVHYGYSSVSQAYSMFGHILFRSKDSIFASELAAYVKRHDDENNAIEEFNDGLFVKKFIISPDSGNALSLRENGYFVSQVPFYVSNNRLNGLVKDGNYYYVHKSHSFVTVTQANHGFIVGDFIYYDSTSSMYEKALAIDDFNINIVGMVDYVNGNTFEYICSGLVETDLFTTAKGYIQGMPLYISDQTPGEVTQVQPDISKAVGYPIADIGIIISIERGIQYNQEQQIGDFKPSVNDYNIRSDGYIKVQENVPYKLSLVKKLIEKSTEDFKTEYLIIDTENETVQFKNVSELYESNSVGNGFNLFIKAF